MVPWGIDYRSLRSANNLWRTVLSTPVWGTVYSRPDLRAVPMDARTIDHGTCFQSVLVMPSRYLEASYHWIRVVQHHAGHIGHNAVASITTSPLHCSKYGVRHKCSFKQRTSRDHLQGQGAVHILLWFCTSILACRLGLARLRIVH